MLLTLNAMKADSEPDASADYWTQRDQIQEAINKMQDLQGQTADLLEMQKTNKEEHEKLGQ